ncbi:MAG: exosortase-associated EpsI family protein [Pirellulales bacterium]|nr:exosortase-associated EpsI family protein [Pirellulales bacterium]
MNAVIISAEIFGAVILVIALVLGVLFRRYEVAIGVVLLFGATLWHARIAGRWQESNIKAEEFAERFQNVPIQVGEWEGEDLEVSDEVKKGSGAVGYVSRIYTNKVTKKQVQFWLIVGHARDICQHQPTACYPAHGAKMQYEPRQVQIPYRGSEPAEFWMTTFDLNEGGRIRVEDHILWAWAKPSPPGEPAPNWIAPKVPRMVFRDTKALYKMYFTSHVIKASSELQRETISAIEFASIFIPEVNQALFTDLATLEGEGTSDAIPPSQKDAAADQGKEAG